MKKIILMCMILTLSIGTEAQRRNKKEITTNEQYGVKNTGTELVIHFERGKEHNHPLFAIWLADENGNFIQTLYVSESIGKGTFKRATRNSGRWLEGEIQRPAALPYWSHQYGVLNAYGNFLPTPQNPVADAYTGATPKTSFVMKVRTEEALKGKYKIMFEINQSWDWNEYWYNDKFPDDREYKTSSQPALVYSVDIDTANKNAEYVLKPIGHSHYSGKDGSLNTDLTTLTTALKIANKISVHIM